MSSSSTARERRVAVHHCKQRINGETLQLLRNSSQRATVCLAELAEAAISSQDCHVNAVQLSNVMLPSPALPLHPARVCDTGAQCMSLDRSCQCCQVSARTWCYDRDVTVIEGHLQSLALLALQVKDRLSPGVTGLMDTCLTQSSTVHTTSKT